MPTEERRRRLASAFDRRGLQPGPDDLERLEAAAGLAWTGTTPAQTGLTWIRYLAGHPGRPGLETHPDAATWADWHQLRIDWAHTDPNQAGAPGEALVRLDGNSTYANAAQSAELGTGSPTMIPHPEAADLDHPGFVTLTRPDPAWPAPFHLVRPDRPVYTGMAAMLCDWIGEPVAMADALVWTEHARHLRTFAQTCLRARAALEAQGAAAAVTALKAVYTGAFGMLNSPRHNRSPELLRPDWLAVIRAHAHMNLWRQLHRATPAPAAAAGNDSSFFIVGRPEDRPAGLEISAKNGKLKVESVSRLTEPIRAAIANNQPGLVLDLAAGRPPRARRTRPR